MPVAAAFPSSETLLPVPPGSHTSCSQSLQWADLVPEVFSACVSGRGWEVKPGKLEAAG